VRAGRVIAAASETDHMKSAERELASLSSAPLVAAGRPRRLSGALVQDAIIASLLTAASIVGLLENLELEFSSCSPASSNASSLPATGSLTVEGTSTSDRPAIDAIRARR
jgi:hypothetical protein